MDLITVFITLPLLQHTTKTRLGNVSSLLKSTPMPYAHISRSAMPLLQCCLQAAARFLGRPQLLTRA